MLLAADIGNTNITFGLYLGDRLHTTFRLETLKCGTADEYGESLLRFLREARVPPQEIDAVIMASVVPGASAALGRGIKTHLKRQPFLVEPHIRTGITVKTDFPEKVGADRIVNAAAAYFYYGPALVIDFGTATTYDVVAEGGEFLGGVIAPGVKICGEALWEKTAKLPKISIRKPDRVLGTNTVSSMQSGLFYGCLGQVEYLAVRLKEELGSSLKTIATGGLSSLFRGCTDAIDIYDEHLTLNGLNLLYRLNHAPCP